MKVRRLNASSALALVLSCSASPPASSVKDAAGAGDAVTMAGAGGTTGAGGSTGSGGAAPGGSTGAGGRSGTGGVASGGSTGPGGAASAGSTGAAGTGGIPSDAGAGDGSSNVDAGLRCDPPYVCLDGGASDICAGGTGVCSMIYNYYSSYLVQARSCTLGAPDQCLYQAPSNLQYPCPNFNTWVNSLDQLNNFIAQWNAAGCAKCVSSDACTNLHPTVLTTGVCTAVTIQTPGSTVALGGTLTTIECVDQP